MKQCVWAVIVTFNPDLERLGRLVTQMRGQCDAVVIVDNASAADHRPKLSLLAGGAEVTLVENVNNEGLGSALNSGAKRARSLGATHFLFCDQDSIPEPNMVAGLMRALEKHADLSVAAVGPEWYDARTKQRSLTTGESGEADFLITSGMLVAADVFSRVGPFDEDLFVDSTDREWCFRAKSMGYRLVTVAGSGLAHQLGDRPIRLFGRVLEGWAHHSPRRLYYMMRNRVLLYRRSYVPLRWKCYDVFRAFGKFFVFSIFIGPRGTNARWMLAGLRDGLRGKTGPLDR